MAKMEPEGDLSPEHLKWLVDARYKSQIACRRTMSLFDTYYKKEKTRKADGTTLKELTAACFSLWRGAFLADFDSDKTDQLKDSKAFLAKILVDNAIGFSQDRSMRGWTFAYYLIAAERHLKSLDGKGGASSKERRERWDTAYSRLAEILERLEKAWVH